MALDDLKSKGNVRTVIEGNITVESVRSMPIYKDKGWINQQIVYLFIFLFMIFSGAGYFIGMDSLATKLEERKHWLRCIFG